MIVKRTYVLSEQGCEDWWGSGHGVAAEIDRREKQKESIGICLSAGADIEWND